MRNLEGAHDPVSGRQCDPKESTSELCSYTDTINTSKLNFHTFRMRGRVTIIGGGISGLTAASYAQNKFDDVVLYDSGSYLEDDRRRGSWGEMVTDYSAIPRDIKVNGVIDESPRAVFRDASGNRIYRERIDAVSIDREAFEKSWFRELNNEVEIRQQTRVEQELYFKICRDSDLVIDASGPFPVSQFNTNSVSQPRKIAETASAIVSGDFSDFYPDISVYPNGKGFMWVKPNSEKKANVGTGLIPGRRQSETPQELLKRLCTERDIPFSQGTEIYSGTVLHPHSRNASESSFGVLGAEVRLVGDATGLVHNQNQFGIADSARTAEAAIKCYGHGNYVRKLRSVTRRNRIKNILMGIPTRAVGMDTIFNLYYGKLKPLMNS